MLTQKDIQLLEKHFATKQELRQMRFEIGDEIQELKDTLHNEIVEFKDAILTEIKSMREELAGYSFRQQEHSHQLENHEQRLYFLEKVPTL